jgi:hypothetical protein
VKTRGKNVVARATATERKMPMMETSERREGKMIANTELLHMT